MSPRRFATPRTQAGTFGTGVIAGTSPISSTRSIGTAHRVAPRRNTTERSAAAGGSAGACASAARGRSGSRRSSIEARRSASSSPRSASRGSPSGPAPFAARISLIAGARRELSDLTRDDREQALRRKRLGQILVRALPHAPEPIGLLILAGDQDHLDALGLGLRLDLSADLEPVLPGEEDVEQNQIRTVFADLAPRLVPVGGGGDAKAPALERRSGQTELGRAVFDDENLGRGHASIPRDLRRLRDLAPKIAAHRDQPRDQLEQRRRLERLGEVLGRAGEAPAHA